MMGTAKDHVRSAGAQRRQRRTSIGLLALAAVAGAAVLFVGWGLTSARPVTAAPVEVAEVQWGNVTEGPLLEETSVEGTLSRGEVFSVSVAQAAAQPVAATPAAATADTSVAAPTTAVATTGTSAGVTRSSTRIVTYLPAVGSTLTSGDVAFGVDGRPTVLLTGTVPAWRSINATTTPGVDVQQLETALQAMGFDSGGWLEVDGVVDDATTEAIKEWQRSLEVEATGEVSSGEVVFEPGDVSVVALSSTVGSVVTPGSSLVDLRRGTPYVDISVDSSWAKVTDQITVSIDQSQVPGTIVSMASGIARISVDGANIRDGATARVTLSRQRVANALLVPVSAIAMSDVLGPTVAIRTEDSESTNSVQVRVLAASNGQAAIEPVSGDIAPGMTVRMY